MLHDSILSTVLAATDEHLLDRLLRPEVLVFVVGGLAVVVGGVVSIAKHFARHKERMSMIRAGMHPDALMQGDSSGDHDELRQ